MRANRIEMIKYGIVLAVGILVTVLFFSVFGKRQKVDNTYREVLAAKDSLISEIRRNRETEREHYSEDIRREQSHDSTLITLIASNQTKYKPLNQKYEAIPFIISSLPKDSLRNRAVTY